MSPAHGVGLGLTLRDPAGVLGVLGTDVPVGAASPAELVVPLLRFVGSRGNTTVYEWRTGLRPLRVERPELQEEPEQPKEDSVRPGWAAVLEGAPSGSAPAGVSGALLSFSP